MWHAQHESTEFWHPHTVHSSNESKEDKVRLASSCQMKHGEYTEAQADGINSSQCHNRKGSVLRKLGWHWRILLPLASRVLKLPLPHRALQISTHSRADLLHSHPTGRRLSAGERTTCRWFSQGRPRSVIPLRGRQGSGGWPSSCTENLRHIQACSNSVHLARWPWETDSQVCTWFTAE